MRRQDENSFFVFSFSPNCSSTGPQKALQGPAREPHILWLESSGAIEFRALKTISRMSEELTVPMPPDEEVRWRARA